MRFRHRQKHDDTEAALANFALTFAKALLVFCVVLFLLVSPKQEKTEEGIKPNIQYMLDIQWPVTKDYDVDFWIQDPEGKILYYGNKEVDFLNLERDDLGSKNNNKDANGNTIPYHQEIISVRGIKPGEYIVNVHLYSAMGYSSVDGVPVEPCPVTFTITKFNPTVKKLYNRTVNVERVRYETHIVRFTLTREGDITNITTELPVDIIQRRQASTQPNPQVPPFPFGFGGGAMNGAK